MASEYIEKAPKIVVFCALQPDTGEKVGLSIVFQIPVDKPLDTLFNRGRRFEADGL